MLRKPQRLLTLPPGPEKKGSFILSPEKCSWAPVHNGGSVAKGRHESERVQEYSDVGGTTLLVANFKL